MAAENVFQENVDYLIEARKTLILVDKIKEELETQRVAAKRLKKTVEAEHKAIEDEVSSTLKRRKEEIAATYDKEIEVNRAKIKQIRAKRDKKKNQRMNQRMQEETYEVKEKNRQLMTEMRTKFKQAHLPRFCCHKWFYNLFLPENVLEYILFFVVSVLLVLGVPVLLSVLIGTHMDYTEMLSGKTFQEAVSYSIVIAVFSASLLGVIYFFVYTLISKWIVMKHKDVLDEGKVILQRIKANQKSIKAIENFIHKEQDDSIYNLEHYDEKLSELEKEAVKIVEEKQNALNVFENDTRNLITEEINKRRMPKYNQMKEEQRELEDYLNRLEEELQVNTLTLSNQYEAYLGKKYVNRETLESLIKIMKSGEASTVSEAINYFKETE
ncbi:MAG: hypothetical protein IJA32_04110 [Lachnospiraceae bacterium]|nr:hypothetical protein [Lachnospiraceae bacterium]